jgi:hypothetical protein
MVRIALMINPACGEYNGFSETLDFQEDVVIITTCGQAASDDSAAGTGSG